MTKRGIRINTTLVVLLSIFLVIVLGGRFIFNNTLPKDDRVTTTDIDDSQNSTSTAEKTQQSTQAVSQATSTPRAPTCAETMQKDLAAKKQSYVKGQILVTFAAELEYQKAKDVLAVYGLVVQNEVESQNSFKTRKLITAAVAPGQEIGKVCMLRNDPQIKYSGLDLYFGIHE